MTGLLICAAVASFVAGWGFLFRWNGRHGPQGWRASALGLALIAVALWLAYAAGGA